MLIYDIKWIAPMKIGRQHGAATSVEGPMQALEVLNDHWPTSGGKHHQLALRECALACKHLGRAEASREAFMAAALEAGVLIFAPSEDRNDGVPSKRSPQDRVLRASVAG